MIVDDFGQINRIIDILINFILE